MAFSHQRAGFAEQKFFLLREIRLRKELQSPTLSALMPFQHSAAYPPG